MIHWSVYTVSVFTLLHDYPPLSVSGPGSKEGPSPSSTMSWVIMEPGLLPDRHHPSLTVLRDINPRSGRKLGLDRPKSVETISPFPSLTLLLRTHLLDLRSKVFVCNSWMIQNRWSNPP